jgi:hypothetical protein
MSKRSINLTHSPRLNTKTSGIQAVKYEPPIDLPINIDQKQSIDLIYGDCIEVNYPVSNVSEYDYLQFIESQFAERNVADFDRKLIDKTIFSLISHSLGQEGIQLPDNSKEAARVKALIFKQVRQIKSDEKLVNYLINKPYTEELFTYDIDCIDASAGTYSGVRNTYGMGRQSVRNAILRLQHILFRNGMLHTLSDTGYAAGRPISKGKKLPDQLRSQAFINWGELLLEKLSDGISFKRFGSKYDVREIIAAIANQALEKNDNKRQNLAKLKYNRDIITPEQIRNIIYTNIGQGIFLKSKQEIETIGAELHRNLFKYADDELGFFSEPLDIAIDPTWVPIDKKFDPQKVPGAMGNKQTDGFKFATGVSFTPMSRLSLGVSLVTDKSTLPAIYRRMILMLEEFTNIGWILADREFDNPKFIELTRTNVGDTWIIRLRDHKGIINQKEYRKLRENGKAKITIGNTTANTFWRDISGSELNWIFSNNKRDDKLILMSGQPLNKTTISKLSSIYSNRWSAESHIRQLKNGFSPKIPGKYALDYLFFYNISSIFYNIYKIISQSLSPTYGLPLRPRYYEVLWGLVESTFRDNQN